jgi:hypothetical protein
MSKELFVTATDVSKELGVSSAYAYRLIRKLNEELSKKGFMTIAGRVSRRYFEEKFYGMEKDQKEEQ